MLNSMKRLLKPLVQLLLVACLGLSLGGCVATRLPAAIE